MKFLPNYFLIMRTFLLWKYIAGRVCNVVVACGVGVIARIDFGDQTYKNNNQNNDYEDYEVSHIKMPNHSQWCAPQMCCR